MTDTEEEEEENGTATKLKELKDELEKEKEIEERHTNERNMASHVAHLYEHHIHVSHFESLMAKLERYHEKPSTTGIISVGLLCLLIGLGLMLPTGSMPISVSTASEPSSTVGSLIVDDAQGCMWWCLKRELLVTRVLRGGCECVDDKGETISMTWSFRQDKTDASNVKVNFHECIESRGY